MILVRGREVVEVQKEPRALQYRSDPVCPWCGQVWEFDREKPLEDGSYYLCGNCGQAYWLQVDYIVSCHTSRSFGTKRAPAVGLIAEGQIRPGVLKKEDIPYWIWYNIACSHWDERWVYSYWMTVRVFPWGEEA